MVEFTLVMLNVIMEQHHSPAGIQANNDANNAPTSEKWIRLPKAGKTCEYSGLGRTYIHKLAKAGKIRTKSLREFGTVRGVRLIWLPSLMKFIADHKGEDAQ